MKTYYILVGRQTKNDPLELIFGDCVRSVVAQELLATRAYCNKKVIKVLGDRQIDLDDAIFLLNNPV